MRFIVKAQFGAAMVRVFLTSAMMAGALSAGVDACAAPPAAHAPFKISRATTYITAPVLPSGRIDYVAAINAMAKRGVTKKNNAGVLLVRTMRIPPLGTGYRARFYGALGIRPPENGQRYHSWTTYALRHFHKQGSKVSRKWQSAIDKISEATMRPWTAAEHPRVAAWLRTMRPSLRLIMRASRRSKLYLPMLSKHPPGTLLSVRLPALPAELGESVGLVRLAMFQAGRSYPEKATGPLLAIYRLAALEHRQPFIISSLVADSERSRANRAMRWLLAHHDLRLPQEETLLRSLRGGRGRDSFPHVINFSERYEMLDTAERMATGDLKGMYEIMAEGAHPPAKMPPRGAFNDQNERAFVTRVRWDVLLTKINRLYDATVKALREPGYMRQKLALQAIVRRYQVAPWQLPWSGSPQSRRAATSALFNFFITQSYPNIIRPWQFRDDCILHQRMVETGLALAIYHAQHHVYPRTLAALTPKLLRKPLKDPFTGALPIYKRNGAGYTMQARTPIGVDGKNRSKTGRGYLATLRVGK